MGNCQLPSPELGVSPAQALFSHFYSQSCQVDLGQLLPHPVPLCPPLWSRSESLSLFTQQTVGANSVICSNKAGGWRGGGSLAWEHTILTG